MASTILASSFEPWKLRLLVSCRPSTAPMLSVQILTPKKRVKEVPNLLHTEQLKSENE